MNFHFPIFISDNETVNKAFRIAYSDMVSKIFLHKDGLLEEEKTVLLAGTGYQKPWTRDAAINVWNAGGLFFPDVAKNTLLSVCRRDESGVRVGGEYWDAVIWVTGAWYYWLYTGDDEFLRLACEISRRTLQYFEATELDESTGLFRGPACYGDGVAAYPDLYADSGRSGIIKFREAHPELLADKGEGLPMMALSTNCLYYNAYVLADRMAGVLGIPQIYGEKARELKQRINRHFWLEDRGYYRYFIDPFGGCDHWEGLGAAFSILFGIADARQTERMLQSWPTTPQGVACVWPSFDRYLSFGENEYGRHSGVVWPFIQSFWADAAAGNGRYDLFEKEFSIIGERAVRDGHFAEIYHPISGEIYGGIQEDACKGIRSWTSVVKQTWSATGYLRMILFDLIGMRFSEEGVAFEPHTVSGIHHMKLENLLFRGVVLNISVEGTGSSIGCVEINGEITDRLIPQKDKEYQILIKMR